MTTSLKRCACGATFKRSPADSTVKCPSCRGRKPERAKTSYHAIECCKCGTTFTSLRCPRCGF